MARALEILVVEDDVSMQRMIEAVFKAATWGEFLLRRATTLAEAVQATQGMAPDLILLDLDLPDAKGLEAVKAMLTRAPNAAILVLTASQGEAMAVEAIKMGVQDWLQKSVALQRFLPRAVSFAVERQRRLVELQAEIAKLKRF